MASTTTARGYETTGDDLLCREGRIIGALLAGWRCPVCNCRMHRGHGDNQRLTYDHVEAHANGGLAEGNLAPMCKGCNSSKRDEPVLIDWLEKRLVALGCYEARNAWCTKAAIKKRAKILALRDALTERLRAEGIW